MCRPYKYSFTVWCLGADSIYLHREEFAVLFSNQIKNKNIYHATWVKQSYAVSIITINKLSICYQNFIYLSMGHFIWMTMLLSKYPKTGFPEYGRKKKRLYQEDHSKLLSVTPLGN